MVVLIPVQGGGGCGGRQFMVGLFNGAAEWGEQSGTWQYHSCHRLPFLTVIPLASIGRGQDCGSRTLYKVEHQVGQRRERGDLSYVWNGYCIVQGVSSHLWQSELNNSYI